MATYGDHIGVLSDESYYRGPGADIAIAKVEALKKSSYLSSMDQFYAQLEETRRQFDIGADFQQQSLDIQESKVNLMEDQIAMQEMLGLKGLELEHDRFESELDFTQVIYDNYISAQEKDRIQESSADTIKGLISSMYNVSAGEVATGVETQNNTFAGYPDIPITPGLSPDVLDFLNREE